MNYETPCNPPPGVANVPGYRFYRDTRGALIARCAVCRVGFVVTDDNAKAVKHAMRVHMDWLHGQGDRLRPTW